MDANLTFFTFSAYKGAHGYDNDLEAMRTFFVARGPAFKNGYHSKVFSAVDFYPMMCHILGITPAPNNGSLETVEPMFSGASRIRNFSNLIMTLQALFLWMALNIILDL